MSFGNNVYNTLNSVTQTAWTPELRFGGATTGITYNAVLGDYHRIGNIVFYRFSINLSSKGSATGDATIAGLPFTVGTNVVGQLPQQNNLDLNANFTVAFTLSNSTTTSLILRQSGPTTATSTIPLTNANFSNNTLLTGSGFYFV